MDAIKVIEIKKSVFADNDKDAGELRKELKSKGVYLLNLMSSPGSGKTTTLIQLLNRIKDKVRVAVMEADIDSDVDAVKIREATGVQSILENVGNLVCPAEFDTGACRNAMILSVPEGHDKPLKYPLMFSVCDMVVINKIDVMPYFDFDIDKCREYVRLRNPKAAVIPICAKTGEGVDALAEWILTEVDNWKK